MSKPISISLAASKPLVTCQQPLSRKRPAANLDSDSDDDDAYCREKVHIITAFDAARGGAVGERPEEEEEEKGPLVITGMKNRDWRAEAERRRGKGSVWLPPEAFAGHAEGEEAVEVDTGADAHYGLQVFQKRTEDSQHPTPPPPGETEGETMKAKTEEEQALAALLSNSSNPPSTTLILPSAADTDWRDRDRDEQQAYKSDVASRPDVPTLDDYAAVPVEEFGAALLRGMGWREGMELGKRGGRAKQNKLLNVEKRPAFLGIGAKAKEEVPELGTWGKADKAGRKRGGKRVDTTYVPVVLVDKKTGRVVDESAAMENGRSTNGGGGGGGGGADRDRWDRRDQERARDDDPDRRRRDRSRDHHRDSRHHDRHHHHRDRDRDRDHHGDRHRDRERGERSHRSRDERDGRRRSRDRYERRDRR